MADLLNWPDYDDTEIGEMNNLLDGGWIVQILRVRSVDPPWIFGFHGWQSLGVIGWVKIIHGNMKSTENQFLLRFF